MSVVIRPWPGIPTYLTVLLGGAAMGYIDQRVLSGIYYFCSYETYDRLNAFDKAQVGEAVSEKIALLNLTQRMLA